MKQARCVAFLANRGFALTSSRRLIIERFLSEGWKVIVVTSDDEHSRNLVKLGAILEPISFHRSSVSLKDDLMTYWHLCRVFKRWRPQLVHNFNAKPVILGSIAASRKMPTTKVVNTVTGLGFAFSRSRSVRIMASIGYRVALRRAALTIFQNPDDMHLFIKHNWITVERSELILGSGVDIERFCPAGKDIEMLVEPRVLMVSRLLKDKGVPEYIEAAHKARATAAHVKFELGGEFDDEHPNAISEESVSSAVQDGDIKFIGYVEDMPSSLQKAHIFVFPSFYGEGVPRVLLEACACGVPVIAADSPGTREAVQDGVTGFLVPPMDAAVLAQRIVELINNPSLHKHMAEAARQRAVKEFDVRVVTNKYFNIYQRVGAILPSGVKN